MIATISPTASAIKHTRNTLHYAGTASTITLAPPKTIEDDAEVWKLPGNYLMTSLRASLMTSLSASLMTSLMTSLRASLMTSQIASLSASLSASRRFSSRRPGGSIAVPRDLVYGDCVWSPDD